MAEAVWALGLMSGTSMDGVDAALLRTDGETIAAFGPSLARDYMPGEMTSLAEVAKAPMRYRPPGNQELARELAAAGAEVDAVHADAALRLILRAPDAEPALIGYHGQTVAHNPEEGWTWQLGDGDALARGLRRPVAWDFRTADMLAGGQGAPLAPFYHFALARHIGATAPVAFLNIGGVANVTWVDPRCAMPEEPGALIAFDTGPGNALINDWMLRRTGAMMDRDGAAAAAGTPDRASIELNSATSYFTRSGPKSLDRDTFALVLERIAGLSTEDGAATLTALTVEAVAAALPHLPMPPSRWLVCGGGRRNATMMRLLAARLGAVAPVEDAGLDGDMLEAQAFAYLAVRCRRGLPLSAPGTTGCAAPGAGGRISR